jgi:hypothetical protein
VAMASNRKRRAAAVSPGNLLLHKLVDHLEGAAQAARKYLKEHPKNPPCGCTWCRLLDDKGEREVDVMNVRKDVAHAALAAGLLAGLLDGHTLPLRPGADVLDDAAYRELMAAQAADRKRREAPSGGQAAGVGDFLGPHRN